MSRFIGAILLILGTSIGAGMLALPMVNAATGFWPSSLLLVMVWLMMTLGAFFILEVNSYLPVGHHLVSMARFSLGPIGAHATWLITLLLLYTLLAAFIAGGSDVLQNLLSFCGLHPAHALTALLFTASFGFIVSSGIYQVDMINRGLMIGKLVIYGLLIAYLTPHIQTNTLWQPHPQFSMQAVLVLITSFGFAIIVPNLRSYFNDDLCSLSKAIIIGSIIPLLCYLLWNAAIMGIVPAQRLTSFIHTPHAITSLAAALQQCLKQANLHALFNAFSAICMLTAFLGVALALFNVLSDGLTLPSTGFKDSMVASLTFLPPLFIVIAYPQAYIYALHYAGLWCVILLLFLPVLMSIQGRDKACPGFTVPGGRILQTALLALAVGIIISAVYSLYL